MKNGSYRLIPFLFPLVNCICTNFLLEHDKWLLNTLKSSHWDGLFTTALLTWYLHAALACIGMHAYQMALPIQPYAPTWLEDYFPTLQLPHRSFIHPVWFAFYPRRHVKSVSGETHGSFFKRSLLLDTVVAKATQRQTTTLLSPSVKTNNLLRGKSSGLILHCRSYWTGILPGTRHLHAYQMALPIQPYAPIWLEDYFPTLQLPHRSFIHTALRSFNSCEIVLWTMFVKF